MKIKDSGIGWRNNWRRDTYALQNLSTCHPFSSSKRRTESYALYRIIVESITTPYATNTHYPSFLTSLPTFAAHTSTRNSTFGGGTITSVSKKATNTKRRLKHATDYLNLLSCFSGSLIRPLHSRLWWITFLRRSSRWYWSQPLSLCCLLGQCVSILLYIKEGGATHNTSANNGTCFFFLLQVILPCALDELLHTYIFIKPELLLATWGLILDKVTGLSQSSGSKQRCSGWLA